MSEAFELAVSRSAIILPVSSFVTWSLVFRAFLSVWPSVQQDGLGFFTCARFPRGEKLSGS